MAAPWIKICLGGTFNPIHYGHLICARTAAEAIGANIVLVPCSLPPHKPDAADLASAEDRLQMCRLAIQGVDGFEIDDLEIRRGGISYTIDTVRELKSRGWPHVHWLIGTDQAATLPTWHRSQELLSEVQFVVMTRTGNNPAWQGAVRVPDIDISATQIRRRVAAGLPIDFLTPPAVVDFIRRRGLWKTDSPP
ncbi:MAG TPA: nicotinate (nicotinamide) nucleotide adenylyltransferase [Tepidisphaeraceae bacterium]|nr:nicotinate (nicotinamide) nucleotide adenylyltransferase [Tepidisphaeraceae bacterium]